MKSGIRTPPTARSIGAGTKVAVKCTVMRTVNALRGDEGASMTGDSERLVHSKVYGRTSKGPFAPMRKLLK